MRIFLPMLLVLASCPGAKHKGAPGPAYAVQWIGSMHEAHTNTTGDGIDLASLAKVPHLYAIGPLAKLRGEMTVLDSAPFIARVEEGAILMDTTFQHQAGFLIYASVERWRDIPVPETILTLPALEDFLRKAAGEGGLPVSEPFPFLLRGAPSVSFHVLHQKDGAPPVSHAAARVSFSLEGKPVEIIGFYSDHHQGVLTHHDQRTHMHLRTKDGSQSGHVDEISLKPGMVLSLPEASQ